LVLGIFLLVLGGLLLAVNLGYGLPVGWWQYLPLLFITFGVWGLLLPNRHVDRVGGVWMIATGVYFLIGIFDWWDLGWSGGWPIFVIAAGLGFMLQRNDGGCFDVKRPERHHLDERMPGNDPGNGDS
jgi:hypothetical protein